MIDIQTKSWLFSRKQGFNILHLIITCIITSFSTIHQVSICNDESFHFLHVYGYPSNKNDEMLRSKPSSV